MKLQELMENYYNTLCVEANERLLWTLSRLGVYDRFSAYDIRFLFDDD